MHDEIKVYVFKRESRKNFEVTWTDPITGKMKMVSTRKSTRSDAERFAGTLQKGLNEGTYKAKLRTTWDEFRNRYEDEKLSGLADKTAEKVWATFNAVEELINPKMLASLDAGQISRFQTMLRAERKIADTTIKGHLRHLRAALNWAVSVGLLRSCPKIEMPARAKESKHMKGRPITAEEFDRMLDKVETIVGKESAPSWKHLLRGLWWSGLRIGEAMNLYWDRPDRICVDTSGKYPMLWIPGALEKGNQDRLHPIAPEFAEFLQATVEEDRTGPVFNPRPRRIKAPRMTAHSVSKLIADIGEAAGVKVNTDPITNKVKFASAHDLRRSFGERWAGRVMPKHLQELMRHGKIETTMKYYVGQNAEDTAAALWKSVEVDTLLDTVDSGAQRKVEGLPQNVV